MNDTESHNSGIGLPVGHELLWYEIKSVLGHGGFGITYLARDKNLGRDVALKEFMPRMWASRHTDFTVRPFASDHEDPYKKGLASFMIEAQTLAKFKHHNIVQVQTVFEQHGTAYMVMEYEQGESLSNQLKLSNFEVTQVNLEKLLFPMMNGLQNVHDAGFLHRDIKPSNIYLRVDGSPVLIDFGSSRQTELLNTNDATVLVSQGYTPLEQYSKGFGEQGPWTDIYALAASVYYAISGKVVVDALHRNATIQTGTSDPVASLSTEVGESVFSREFIRAIDNGLNLNPRERPQTLALWRAMFEPRQDETVLLSPVAAGVVAVPIDEPLASINEAVTRVQEFDEPWLHASDKTDLDDGQLSKPGASLPVPPKNKGLPKSIYLAGLVGVIAMLAAGGTLFMQKDPLPLDNQSENATVKIDELPRPDRAIDIEVPVDRIDTEVKLLDRQWGLYAQAKELGGNLPEILSGISSVGERYELLAMSSTVRNNTRLSEIVSEGIVKSIGVNADNQATIARLVAGSSSMSLDKLRTLLGKPLLSSDEKADLLYGISGLSVEDRRLLSTVPEFAALTENFNATIIAQVKAGEFALAALMTNLALMVQPSDKQLIQLKQHLSGEK